MEKIVKIPITFHDIVNVLMWDDDFNKDNVTSRVPCGKKISYWLARAFTLSNIKNMLIKVSTHWQCITRNLYPIQRLR